MTDKLVALELQIEFEFCLEMLVFEERGALSPLSCLGFLSRFYSIFVVSLGIFFRAKRFKRRRPAVHTDIFFFTVIVSAESKISGVRRALC